MLRLAQRSISQQQNQAAHYFDHVIIGGGITGASTAYHLSKFLNKPSSNKSDNLPKSFSNIYDPSSPQTIAIIDRDTLGSGQTARSAGLIVLQSHKTEISKNLASVTNKDCKRFGAFGTFESPGFAVRSGSLNVNNGAYEKDDFYVDASTLANEYVRNAKQAFLTSSSSSSSDNFNVFENSNVSKIRQLRDGKLQIEIDNTDFITCKRVYNTAGIWSNHVNNLLPGRGHTQNGPALLPWVNMRSHYWEFRLCTHSVFKALEKLSAEFPNLRENFKDGVLNGSSFVFPAVFKPGMYLKISHTNQPISKVEIGIQEKQSSVFSLNDDKNFENWKLLEKNDFELSVDSEETSDFGPVDMLFERSSDLEDFFGNNFFANAEMHAYISGLSTYTADGLPVIHSDLNGRMVGSSGCCGYGVTWSGGIGKMLAELGLGAAADVERNVPSLLSTDRFGSQFHGNIQDLEKAAVAIRANKMGNEG